MDKKIQKLEGWIIKAKSTMTGYLIEGGISKEKLGYLKLYLVEDEAIQEKKKAGKDWKGMKFKVAKVEIKILSK